jgi:5-methylcytosine-specific restriction endonuclease McrA
LIGKYRKDFLRGLLLGDGYITEEFNKVAFNVASFQLVMDVQSIALGMGMHVTIQAGERPDGRRYWSAVFQGDNYVKLMREVLGRSLDYAEADYPKRQFGNDGFVFRKLTDVCEAEPCVVYNIEVEGSSSYIANGVAVHNCQFCGKKCPTEKLTMDHVVPKSKGGRVSWTNVVLACEPCNARKGDKTLKEAGMTLIRRPFEPRAEDLRASPADRLRSRMGRGMDVPKTWEAFLGKMYWDVQLDQE